jgi:hypothetical protein
LLRVQELNFLKRLPEKKRNQSTAPQSQLASYHIFHVQSKWYGASAIGMFGLQADTTKSLL